MEETSVAKRAFRKKVSVRDEMAPRSAQRRPRRSSNPFLRHEPRELRGRVRACRARRAQPRSRRDSPGRRSRRAPPARKVNCPVSLTRPSHLTPAERPRERAGPSSITRTAACRTPSTPARTRGSRRSRPSRTAGEPRLPVRHVSKHERRPRLPIAPARFSARFARNASGLARRDSGNTRGRRPCPRPRLPRPRAHEPRPS